MPQNRENGFITASALPLVELQGADIKNEGNLILSDVSFTVKSGELLYIVGRGGSGKSSIIKTLTAELPAEGKVVRVGDYDLIKIRKKQIPYLRRNLGVVFQDFQLLTERTVMENLLFVLRSTGWKDETKMEFRCNQVLDMVGLSTKAHKMPHQLSGGEQQRVAIARALLNSPSVILADEPTGNLDAETAEGIMNLLMKIHHDYKPAIIIVTHNRTILDKFPGRVLLCSGGNCKEVTDELTSNFTENPNGDMPA